MSFEGYLKNASFASVVSGTAFDDRSVKGRCRLVGFSLTPQFLAGGGSPQAFPNPNGTVKLEDTFYLKTESMLTLQMQEAGRTRWLQILLS
jgi:hypothetical protein